MPVSIRFARVASVVIGMLLCGVSVGQVGFGDAVPTAPVADSRFDTTRQPDQRIATAPVAPAVSSSEVVPASDRNELRVPSQSGGLATNLLGMIRSGGPMFIPLAICSFLLFLFVFERSISLRGGRVIPKPFVRRFVEQLQEGSLDSHTALDRCDENGSPIAEVFAAGVKKWDRSTVEVEQAVIDAGERVGARLRKYLRLFNGIATISPLLGLLGTVMGMITAFNTIATADGMGKPELLATGISQALLTTAAGLTVAIPAIIAYLHFSSRADKLLTEIDQYGQQIVNEIAVDGWKERPKKKVKTRAAA